MNILYLIGNGFDLNLGLKTSYKDFLNYYKALKMDHQKDSILRFISYIEDKKLLGDPNWSDIEIQMGQYTETFMTPDSVDVAKDFHDDLVFALSEYIKTQCDIIQYTQDVEKDMCKYLSFPEMNEKLLPSEQRDFKSSFRKRWEGITRWNLNIITFNYTNTLETIIKPKIGKELGTYFPATNKGNIFLNTIEHIHGFVDDRLILGLDNVSQIANVDLRKTSAMNWYLKSRSNTLTGQEHDNRCRNLITEAHLICLFGFSIGDTDKQWWANIVNRLKSDNHCRLIIYVYDPNAKFNNLQYARLDEYRQKQKDFFLKQSGVTLSADQMNSIKSRILIALNSDMFKFNVNPNANQEIYEISLPA
ncbi:MAG: bacteriophage abortive infection AbiH family protein [Alistipes sp.]|nr:bacteriophage abortive infection AbiH family protein [Alistipes sp.]